MDYLDKIIDKALEDYPKAVDKYKEDKEISITFFMAIVMKETRGIFTVEDITERIKQRI